MKKTTPSACRLLKTKHFHLFNAFLKSDLPEPVKEAALFNISTLRSQTVFRTAMVKCLDGKVFLTEQGAGFGSCTHVWNYEQATAFLFGDLAKTMRDVEFGYSTDTTGKMSFRAVLPLNKSGNFPLLLQMGKWAPL